MFTALADEVTTVTSTSSSWSFNLNIDILGIVLILFALYDIVMGIMTIAKKKLYIGGKDKGMDKYTEESIVAQTPKFGLAYILFGLGIGGWQVLKALGAKTLISDIPLIAGAVLGIVVYIIAYRKLVKKTTDAQ